MKRPSAAIKRPAAAAQKRPAKQEEAIVDARPGFGDL